MARASFDATLASATIAFNNTDYFVSVLPPAVQVAKNPQ
jgi:pyruvoyl-dependent arginine decarboxylase (PvlArgDC)